MTKSAESDLAGMGRAAHEQRSRILGVFEQEGRVEVSELSETLAVAEETIRRDMRAIEEERLLRRAHGGASRVSTLVTDLNRMTAPERPTHPVASVKRTVVDAAERVVLIAERSQLAVKGPVKFAHLGDLDHVVIDECTDDAVLTMAAEAGAQVLVASNEEGTQS